MKSIKLLLSALVVSGIFASCAKEEITIAPENQNQEFVGAELIGSNIAVNFQVEGTTKVTNGDWDSNDLLGLGWVVKTSYSAEQKAEENYEPDQSELYANHMFQQNAAGQMVSKGNIYKGWHFGYYPFKYQESLGSVLQVPFNTEQKAKGGEDERKSTALHLSPLRFLDASLLDATYQFKEGLDMPMYNVYKTINVNITPSEEFTGDPVLSNLKIESIKLKVAGQNIFPSCSTLTIDPTALAPFEVAKDAEDAVIKVNGIPQVDAAKTKKAFYKSVQEDGVLGSSINKVDNITTEIANDAIKLDGKQTLRIHTLPAATSVIADTTCVEFTIEVEGGIFTIGYTAGEFEAGANLKDWQITNNAAIRKLLNNYNTAKAANMTGYYTNYGTDGKYLLPGVGLELALAPETFEPDFTAIKSETEWNAAVAVVNRLGKKSATFKIAKNTQGENWKFEDIDNDGNLINLPTVTGFTKLTVDATGEDIILAKEGNWPVSTAFEVNTNVVVEKDLTVTGAMKVANDKEIINNATIKAGAASSIGVKDTGCKLDNTNGRVVVEYGAYVYPAPDKNGVIAYVVEDASPASIVKINTLLNHVGANTQLANVNTLIVKTILNLNASAVAGVTGDDRYNTNLGAVPAQYLTSLHNVDIELDNGTLITSATGTNQSVKNVVAVSGTNSIIDITLGYQAGGPQIGGNINVNKNAILNINSAETNTLAKVVNMEIDGTVNVNIKSLTADKVILSGGSINVAENNFLVWMTQSTLNGTTSGSITQGITEATALNTLMGYLPSGSVISLGEDVDLSEPLMLTTDKNITVNLNGKTITGKTGSVNNGDVFVVEKGTLTIDGAGEVIGSSDNLANACAVWVYGTGSAIIKSGSFKVGNHGSARNDCIYVKENGTITIEGGVFEYTGGNPAGKQFLLNVKNEDTETASMVVKGGIFRDFNPAKNISHLGENATVTPTFVNFVADGYVSTKIAGTPNDWKVTEVK